MFAIKALHLESFSVKLPSNKIIFLYEKILLISNKKQEDIECNIIIRFLENFSLIYNNSKKR